MIEILVFGSEFCKPCKGWLRLLKKNGISYKYIDVEKDTEKTNKYEVKSLPSTVMLVNDRVVFFYAGVSSKAIKDLLQILRRYTK